jgi:hypothetical protein
VERLSNFLPNRAYPYKNYFERKLENGKMVTKYSRLLVDEEIDGDVIFEDSDSNTSKSQIVYWLVDGAVYHNTKTCKCLQNSVDIRIGTIDQSGKVRGCAKCSS